MFGSVKHGTEGEAYHSAPPLKGVSMRRENVLSPHVLIAAGMLSLCACSGSTPEEEPVEPISDYKETVSVRIESDGTGNCNFDASDDLNVASLNNTDYA